MSYDIFKKQAKYCVLNIEDKELQKMRENRVKKDTTSIITVDKLSDENVKYFKELKETKQKIPDKIKNRINRNYSKKNQDD